MRVERERGGENEFIGGEIRERESGEGGGEEHAGVRQPRIMIVGIMK